MKNPMLLYETHIPCFFWGAGGVSSSSEDETTASVLTAPFPLLLPLISESNIASEDTSLTKIVNTYQYWKLFSDECVQHTITVK